MSREAWEPCRSCLILGMSQHTPKVNLSLPHRASNDNQPRHSASEARGPPGFTLRKGCSCSDRQQLPSGTLLPSCTHHGYLGGALTSAAPGAARCHLGGPDVSLPPRPSPSPGCPAPQPSSAPTRGDEPPPQGGLIPSSPTLPTQAAAPTCISRVPASSLTPLPGVPVSSQHPKPPPTPLEGARPGSPSWGVCSPPPDLPWWGPGCPRRGFQAPPPPRPSAGPSGTSRIPEPPSPSRVSRPSPGILRPARPRAPPPSPRGPAPKRPPAPLPPPPRPLRPRPRSHPPIAERKVTEAPPRRRRRRAYFRLAGRGPEAAGTGGAGRRRSGSAAGR